MCVDVDRIMQSLKAFKEKKSREQAKELDYKEKLNLALTKIEQMIKIISEEKQKSEKEMQELNLTITKLLKESEMNMIK